MPRSKNHRSSPTYIGYIATSNDALIILQSVLNGVLQPVQRRPLENERKDLIKSGNVFVFIEESSGIKRWTDGTSWSPSRILGRFLIYRELSKNLLKDSSNTNINNINNNNNNNTATITTKNNNTNVNKPNTTLSSKTMVKSESSSSTQSTLPNLKLSNQPITAYAMAGGEIISSINKRKRLREDSLNSNSLYQNSNSSNSSISSVLDDKIYRSDGLIKKSMSLCLYPNSSYKKTIHLVSYYRTDDVVNNLLTKPSDDTNIKSINLNFELLEALKNTSLGHAVANKKTDDISLESHGFVDTDGFDQKTLLNFTKEYNEKYSLKRTQLNHISSHDTYRQAYYVDDHSQNVHKLQQQVQQQVQQQMQQQIQQIPQQVQQIQQYQQPYQQNYQMPPNQFNFKYDYGYNPSQHTAYPNNDYQQQNAYYQTVPSPYPSRSYTPQTSMTNPNLKRASPNSYGYINNNNVNNNSINNNSNNINSTIDGFNNKLPKIQSTIQRTASRQNYEQQYPPHIPISGDSLTPVQSQPSSYTYQPINPTSHSSSITSIIQNQSPYHAPQPTQPQPPIHSASVPATISINQNVQRISPISVTYSPNGTSNQSTNSQHFINMIRKNNNSTPVYSNYTNSNLNLNLNSAMNNSNNNANNSNNNNNNNINTNNNNLSNKINSMLPLPPTQFQVHSNNHNYSTSHNNNHHNHNHYHHHQQSSTTQIPLKMAGPSNNGDINVSMSNIDNNNSINNINNNHNHTHNIDNNDTNVTTNSSAPTSDSTTKTTNTTTTTTITTDTTGTTMSTSADQQHKYPILI